MKSEVANLVLESPPAIPPQLVKYYAMQHMGSVDGQYRVTNRGLPSLYNQPPVKNTELLKPHHGDFCNK